MSLVKVVLKSVVSYQVATSSTVPTAHDGVLSSLLPPPPDPVDSGSEPEEVSEGEEPDDEVELSLDANLGLIMRIPTGTSTAASAMSSAAMTTIAILRFLEKKPDVCLFSLIPSAMSEFWLPAP